ncbi:PKD domain-containing protein [Saccharothrix hoggarensis]|uniref:PKD domain-containing protein n=1 Tax=Saccharothrix hoggarensis TaxID=913853 RepID=A0ABW3QT23_9PSEU
MLSSRWRASTRARIAAISTTTAVAAVLLTGVAHAEPPTNDDFDASTPVTALPFTARQDTSEATGSADDPYWCQGYDVEGGVWFTHTAAADGFLRATTAGSDHSTVLSAQTGVRGELHGVDNACATGANATMTFRATAGATYHFFVAGYRVAGGALSFALDTVPTSPNDAFAAAEPVPTLPLTLQPGLSTATFEADEPESTCAYAETVPSVWYAYTTPGPATSVTARVEGGETAVTVYTGASLTALTQVTCMRPSFGETAVFRAEPGTTHYLRVTGPARSYEPVRLHLAEAPALRPTIYQSPSEPSVFDEVHFSAESWNPIDEPMTAEWDFGDGTTAPASQETVSHHYTSDGSYQVTLRATSPDGRTATATTRVEVETHDVSITRFDVPSSAREGDTRSITVHVGNTRYPEKATVTLYKSDGGSWDAVGSLTLDVPARPTRKVQFPFSYTFTPDDARVGKVAFRARVELPYPARDARPADNEVTSIATTVSARAGGMGAV